jgi:hypothetical protein
MAAIYSNGGNHWNILGFNFTKRDALSSVYKISMVTSAILYLRRISIQCKTLRDRLFDFLQTAVKRNESHL